MSIPRNLGNFADNVNTNGKVEVTGINATGTPSASTALLGNGTWGTVTTSPAGSTGQVQYNNAGAFGAISSGTSGQVLTSQGSGSAPTWSSGGSLIFLSSQTVTSGVASVDFTNVLSSTYDDYIVYFDAMVFSSTSARFYLRIEKSGSFQTTNNGYSYTPLKNATTVTPVVNAAAAEIRLADGSTTTNATWGGSILFTNANGASFVTVIVSDLYITGSASTMARYVSGGFNETASNATGFQLYPSTGTMTAGNFRLYGIKKS